MSQKNRAEAREIMKKLGYGPDKPLVTKISTRDIPSWRQPAVLLNAQLKEIYIDAELDVVDTTQWYPKIMRKDFTIGAVPIETGVDDPDQMFYENFHYRRGAQLRRLLRPRIRQAGRRSNRSRPTRKSASRSSGRSSASWRRRRCGRCCFIPSAPAACSLTSRG